MGLNHHSLEKLILLKEIWRICQWLLCLPIYISCFRNFAPLESAKTSKTIIKSLKLAINQNTHSWNSWIKIHEWLWNYNVNPILGMLCQNILPSSRENRIQATDPYHCARTVQQLYWTVAAFYFEPQNRLRLPSSPPIWCMTSRNLMQGLAMLAVWNTK